ncbi:MAG: alpha/beta fold hydrolase, partial [Cytophagia bacterium]|nr:alpha/beta fold hydrolase [Cytophagia bacterium]
MPEINFKTQGDGFPVILIHGFCEHLEMWNYIIEQLSEDYKVIAVDLPGFGKSPLLSSPISLEIVAQTLVDWLKNQGIDQAVFLGHSLGGYVSLALAEMFPELIKGFGLIHSTAFADTEEGKVNRDRVVQFIQKHGHEKWIET